MAVARRSVFLKLAILSLLATACSDPPTQSAGRIFGVVEACAPSPDVATSLLYSPGAFTLEDGSSLSDVTVGIESPTGYDGEVVVAVVDTDDFSGGFGIPYDESLDFRSMPTTAQGPGDFHLILLVEHRPQSDDISFNTVEFEIDGERFVSRENDTFELEISQSGCA